MSTTTQTVLYPCFGQRTSMLASVKEGLYHPMLPTFRRMDMDTAMHKLPEEHSRTTTPLSRKDFKNSTITLFRPADRPLSGTRITETGRQLQATSYQPIESGGMSEFLQRSMTAKSRERQLSSLAPNEPLEPYTFMPEPYLKYSADQMKFNGYATRYLSPRETGSWRYSLRQEPFIDLRGQRPIPATIYSRYRDAHPRASVAAMHWR
ncbi:sperm microtubule inner protein 8-like isoform X2 [Montipora capricornis]|uniref:sperm microtubule inner protein 8-like isoform X2 n=1 Tax=Montipora foliosa TaxID=591990 RepID=UPI0035F1FC12